MSKHEILNNADHRDLRVHTEAGAALGDAVMAALIVPAEFRRVQSEYPIVFRRDHESGNVTALALFGFENGENLFLEGGEWQARYRPLSISIQPFLVGQPSSEGGEGQVHIDMEHPRVSANGEGVRVFDADGGTTPLLEEIAGKLGELHAGYQASGKFFAALERHGLLEAFSFEVPLSDGSKHSLVGFHIINEDVLRALDGDALGDLHAGGHLMPIFMALASLSQLAELATRRDARIRDG